MTGKDIDTYLAYCNAKKLPISQIDKETYNENLCVLPPLDWRHGDHSESFKMIEMYCGDITEIYVRFRCDYFVMRDNRYLTHNQIMVRVEEFYVAQEKEGTV